MSLDVAVRPIPGRGIVARFGDVLLVSEDAWAADRPLLTSLIEACRTVSSTGADGRRLVRRLAAIVAEPEEEPPAFCVVAPSGPDVFLFAHGDAEIVVRRQGGAERICGRDSAAWVDRRVEWPVDELIATVPGSGTAGSQDLLDLRSGIVPGAGFSLGPTVTQTTVASVASRDTAAAPPGEIAAAPPGEIAAAPATEPHVSPEPQETADQAPTLQCVPPPGYPPPTTGHVRFGATLLVEPDESATSAPIHRYRRDNGLVTVPNGLAMVDDPAVVAGVNCSRGHFSDPQSLFCAVCGIGLVQQTHDMVKGRRTPLGVLVLDDGTTLVLDHSYVLGRDPECDDDVREGRARPVTLDGEGSTISRAHVAVLLHGWTVEICDRASRNGSYIAPPGAPVWTLLSPFEPVSIPPGTRVQFGSRSLVYDSRHRI